MDEYQEYLRLFGDLPFGMRPKFEDYQKQLGAQTARDTLTQGIAEGDLDRVIFFMRHALQNCFTHSKAFAYLYLFAALDKLPTTAKSHAVFELISPG